VWDLETTIPQTDILEIGIVIYNQRTWQLLVRWESLVHSTKQTVESIECNGITKAMVEDSPKFKDIAHMVYFLLHGKMWIGHNIRAFDIPVLEKNFAKLGFPSPQPRVVVDTLPLLRDLFTKPGNRLQDTKMNSLCKYFALGEEKHRAMADCLATMEVLKLSALQLLLEANFDIVGKKPDDKNPCSSSSSDGSATISSSSAAAISKNEAKFTEMTITATKKFKMTENNDHQKLIADLNEAMENAIVLTIIYKEGPARKIKPIKWKTPGIMLEGFCERDQKVKSWSVDKITIMDSGKLENSLVNNTFG
jgi:DNA polymerase III epsilon subunit-like protein